MKRASGPEHAYSHPSNDKKTRGGIGRFALIVLAALLVATTVQAFTVAPRGPDRGLPPEVAADLEAQLRTLMLFPCQQWPMDSATEVPIALLRDPSQHASD